MRLTSSKGRRSLSRSTSSPRTRRFEKISFKWVRYSDEFLLLLLQFISRHGYNPNARLKRIFLWRLDVRVIFYPHAQSFEESNDDTIYFFSRTHHPDRFVAMTSLFSSQLRLCRSEELEKADTEAITVKFWKLMNLFTNFDCTETLFYIFFVSRAP